MTGAGLLAPHSVEVTRPGGISSKPVKRASISPGLRMVRPGSRAEGPRGLRGGVRVLAVAGVQEIAAGRELIPQGRDDLAGFSSAEMKCRIETISRAAGSLQSISPAVTGSLMMLHGSRMSRVMTRTAGSAAARP